MNRTAALLALSLAAAGCAVHPPRIPTLFTEPIAETDRPRPAPRPAPPPASGQAPPAAAAPAPASPSTPVEAWRPTPPPPAATRTVPPAPLARELRLANGLRIVVVEHHARPVVLMTLLLPRGALSDPPGAPGASSLAVQIATDFRELDERGDEIQEERSLRRMAAEKGGALSSDAGHEVSGYTIAGFAGDTRTYLKLLAEALRTPRHGPQSFKGRRDARLDFLEDLRASDAAAIERVMAEAAFGQGHPYARSAIGTHASLTKLGLEEVTAHQAALLVPDGATLLVIGDVDAAVAIGEAKAAFQAWAGKALPEPVVAQAGGQVAPGGGRAGLGVLRRQPASTLLTCATRPLGGVRASDAALDLLAAHLGEGPASRLAQALRDGGHTYSVSAGVERRRHGRAFIACSPLAADRAGEGLRAFREALEAVRAAPPTAAELAHARGLVQGGLDAGWDDAARIHAAWVDAVALGEDRPRPERRRTELAAVTADELWQVAREVLRPEAVRWVVSGEPAAAERAAQANGLGKPVALSLTR